jgi:hypothetical protein
LKRIGSLILLAALAAGCGGSSTLSSNELLARATRVCRLAAAQTARIPTPSTPDGTTLYLQRGIAVMKPELDQLRSLRPPDDVADVYRVSMTTFARKLSYLSDTVHDLAGGEDPVIAMRTLQKYLAPVESQEDGAWQALQIPACVNR